MRAKSARPRDPKLTSLASVFWDQQVKKSSLGIYWGTFGGNWEPIGVKQGVKLVQIGKVMVKREKLGG